MLTKIRFLTLAITVVILAGLVYISVVTHQKNYDNLLFAAPVNQSASGGASLIENLEKLNLESFMLTYEILVGKQVSTELSRESAVVKWTNFTYPYVCNYNMISGAFFTQAAQEQQIKSAVLNVLAAFELFGGSNIIGSQIIIDSVYYTVTGVINDHDTENNNVYLPVTLQTQGPNAIITVLNKNAVSEFVINELKSIGISDTSHTFYELGLISGIVTGRAYIAFALIICAIMIFIFRKCFREFKHSRAELSQLYKYNTLVEVVKLSPGETIKAFITGILILFSAGIFLWTASDIANRILEWGTYISDIDEYITDFFIGKLNVIQKYSGYSNIMFTAFVVLIILDVILFLDSGE